MKFSKSLPQLILLSIVLLFSDVNFAQTSFSDFIAFGDSLSDTGNINSGLPNLPDPPYFDNRISNGRVGVDYISESIGFNATASQRGGSNYAVAGGNIVGGDREDLSAQIDDYLADVDRQADPTALYFLMMGGNDMRGLRSQTSREVAEARITEIISMLIQQLQRLSAAGAKRFYVSNLADLGRIPETLQRKPSDPGVSSRLSLYSQIYNTDLNQALIQFATQSKVEILQFDLYSEFQTILDDPSRFGFSYITIGCLDKPPFGYSSECIFGFRFDEFVFFDNLHPSRASNQIIGNKMVAVLQDYIFSTAPPPKHSLIAVILLLLLDQEDP